MSDSKEDFSPKNVDNQSDSQPSESELAEYLKNIQATLQYYPADVRAGLQSRQDLLVELAKEAQRLELSKISPLIWDLDLARIARKLLGLEYKPNVPISRARETILPPKIDRFLSAQQVPELPSEWPEFGQYVSAPKAEVLAFFQAGNWKKLRVPGEAVLEFAFQKMYFVTCLWHQSWDSATTLYVQEIASRAQLLKDFSKEVPDGCFFVIR